MNYSDIFIPDTDAMRTEVTDAWKYAKEAGNDAVLNRINSGYYAHTQYGSTEAERSSLHLLRDSMRSAGTTSICMIRTGWHIALNVRDATASHTHHDRSRSRSGTKP